MSSVSKKWDRVLITNDDGIDAPGLAVAVEVAQSLFDEVWVSAPAWDCSGTSRQVSLHQPLRVATFGERRVAVSGSPADSVIVGLRHLMKDHAPDLVISGVNAGANQAKEVGYSGTVGAALTARMLGVPAVALSQAWQTRGNVPWDTARAWLPRVLRRLLTRNSWPDTAILNINVPCVSPEQVSGIEVTRLATMQHLDVMVDERIDHRENSYFWLAFRREQRGEEPDSDVAALSRNAVSVTPIGLDLTAHELREAAQQLLAGF